MRHFCDFTKAEREAYELGYDAGCLSSQMADRKETGKGWLAAIVVGLVFAIGVIVGRGL